MTDPYLKFFGLRERPFNSNADLRYMHLTHTLAGTLAELVSGIQNRKGFLVLTGEVGTGKTTLIRRLLDWLGQNQIATAYIFNSRMDTAGLFNLIVAEFGISSDTIPRGDSLKALQNWLLARGRADGTAVLVVDEAQGLSCQVLDDLRLLLDLEARGERPLQVVLAGQPELDDKLRKPELRQLRQRIAVRCRTAPLTIDETSDYIRQRLKIAGAAGEIVFEKEAANAVYFYSLGVPRVINLLCDRALAAASGLRIKPVPVCVVEEAAAEFEFDELKPRAVSRYSHLASFPDWMTGDTPARAMRPRGAEGAGPFLVQQHHSSAPLPSAAPPDAVLAFSAAMGAASQTFAREKSPAVAAALEDGFSEAALSVEASAVEVVLEEASILTLDSVDVPDEIEEIPETGTRIEIFPAAHSAAPSDWPSFTPAGDPGPKHALEICSQPPATAEKASIAASSVMVPHNIEEISGSETPHEVFRTKHPVEPGNTVSLRPAAARGAMPAPESPLEPALRHVTLRASSAPRREWVPAPPPRRAQRAPWWWSARDVWDLQEWLSVWREGFLSFARVTAQSCREINESVSRWLRASMGPRRESVVRWLRAPMGHTRGRFIDRQD